MPLAFLFIQEQLKVALFDRYYFLLECMGLPNFFLLNVKGLPSRIGEFVKNNTKKFSRLLF